MGSMMDVCLKSFDRIAYRFQDITKLLPLALSFLNELNGSFDVSPIL